MKQNIIFILLPLFLVALACLRLLQPSGIAPKDEGPALDSFSVKPDAKALEASVQFREMQESIEELRGRRDKLEVSLGEKRAPAETENAKEYAKFREEKNLLLAEKSRLERELAIQKAAPGSAERIRLMESEIELAFKGIAKTMLPILRKFQETGTISGWDKMKLMGAINEIIRLTEKAGMKSYMDFVRMPEFLTPVLCGMMAHVSDEAMTETQKDSVQTLLRDLLSTRETLRRDLQGEKISLVEYLHESDLLQNKLEDTFAGILSPKQLRDALAAQHDKSRVHFEIRVGDDDLDGGILSMGSEWVTYEIEGDSEEDLLGRVMDTWCPDAISSLSKSDQNALAEIAAEFVRASVVVQSDAGITYAHDRVRKIRALQVEALRSINSDLKDITDKNKKSLFAPMTYSRYVVRLKTKEEK